MAVPETRDELLAAIEKTFVQLERDLDRGPLGTVRDPVLDGHAKDTKMSPSDLVAYLIGWNQQVLIWHNVDPQAFPMNSLQQGLSGINLAPSLSVFIPSTKPSPGTISERSCVMPKLRLSS